jgi:hypothetical protein
VRCSPSRALPGDRSSVPSIQCAGVPRGLAPRIAPWTVSVAPEFARRVGSPWLSAGAFGTTPEFWLKRAVESRPGAGAPEAPDRAVAAAG